METYRIKKDFDTAWVNVRYRKVTDHKYYTEQIAGLKPFTADEPIYLEVDQFDEAPDENWAFQDYFEWKSGEPKDTCMVISERFKNFLSEKYLSIPKHYIYPAEIWNSRLRETRTDYYVLHFAYNLFEEIDTEKSEFGMLDLTIWKIVKSYIVEKEILISDEIFNKFRSELYSKTKEMVYPTKLVFKKGYTYDLLSIPIISGAVYTNEKAMQGIISHAISGIDFVATDKDEVARNFPKIIMGNEN